MNTLTRRATTIGDLIEEIKSGHQVDAVREQWISPSQMGELLNLHINTVYRILQQNEIPVYDMTVSGGKRYFRIRRRDMEEWLESRRR